MFWIFHLACRDLNVIPHLMKQSKMPPSFQPILVSLCSSFSDEKSSLSESMKNHGNRHPHKLRLNREKKPFEGVCLW